MGWGSKERPRKVECGLLPKISVSITDSARRKMEILMMEYPHQEWMAYMVGFREENNFRVLDISVPEHEEVSSCHALAKPHQHPGNCLGVVHSHHSMGAFHSGTDNDHVDHNYPISLTLAMKAGTMMMDTHCVASVKTECGVRTAVDCTVIMVGRRMSVDEETFLEDARQKVNMGKASTRGAVRAYRGDGITSFLPDLTQEGMEQHKVRDVVLGESSSANKSEGKKGSKREKNEKGRKE